MTEHDRWTTLVQDIHSSGCSLLGHVAAPSTDGRAQSLAFSLLARTLSNFTGAVLLLKHGQVVEARALVRCCLENEFFLGALALDPAGFWKQLEEDDVKHRQLRGKEFFKSSEADENVARRLKEWMERSEKEFPKPKMITPKGIAGGNPTYIAYSQLSSDAGHASLTSLQRYLKRGEDGVPRFVANPKFDDEIIHDTYKWGCLSVIRACGTVNTLIGKPENDRLQSSVELFGKLLGMYGVKQA